MRIKKANEYSEEKNKNKKNIKKKKHESLKIVALEKIRWKKAEIKDVNIKVKIYEKNRSKKGKYEEAK